MGDERKELPTVERAELCDTCRNFDEDGMCHRFPPLAEVGWPTMVKQDWCGEWKAKGEDQGLENRGQANSWPDLPSWATFIAALPNRVVNIFETERITSWRSLLTSGSPTSMYKFGPSSFRDIVQVMMKMKVPFPTKWYSDAESRRLLIHAENFDYGSG